MPVWGVGYFYPAEIGFFLPARNVVDSDVIQVPGILELPLTLECKIIYKQKQDLSCLPQSVIDRFYPVVDEEGFRDYHIAYYGEIVNAYLAES